MVQGPLSDARRDLSLTLLRLAVHSHGVPHLQRSKRHSAIIMSGSKLMDKRTAVVLLASKSIIFHALPRSVSSGNAAQTYQLADGIKS